jgi:hypothetical protein
MATGSPNFHFGGIQSLETWVQRRPWRRLMINNKQISLAFLALASFLLPSALLGQQEGTDVRTGALRVYLDCEGARQGCESNHFRTEITFVNWVRQVQDAQLNIIFTSSSTGSGDEFMLDFIGREELEGTDDHLIYSHSDTDTDDARTQGLTGVLAVGVARYAVLAGQEGPFTVNTPEERTGAPDLPPGLQGEVNDPWDYWVFRLGGDVRFEDEDLKDEKRYTANFSANRTTEVWKVSLSGRGTYTDIEGQYSSGTKYTDVRKEGSVSGDIRYTLAERWSAGLDGGVATSTRSNQDLSGDFGGGVEYSFFPYRDWTRRRMTAQAVIHAKYYDYEEETLFNKMTEVVAQGSLKWGLGFRQPWGTANVNASASGLLQDPATFYNLSFGGSVSIRVARGLEWNVGGNISRIHDQIYIPLEQLSDEDILLGRRSLPTDSRLSVNTGFSFTFGSIYNNVVNNRFSPAGGFGGMGGMGGGGGGRGED